MTEQPTLTDHPGVQSSTVDLLVWTSAHWPCDVITELFSGLGYAIRPIGTESPANALAKLVLVVVGQDTDRLPEQASSLSARYGGRSKLVCLSISKPTQEVRHLLRLNQIALVQTAEEPGASFQRIAAAFDIDIRTDSSCPTRAWMPLSLMSYSKHWRAEAFGRGSTDATSCPRRCGKRPYESA